MIKLPQLVMVFDVEAIGLHGEGFAVGYNVANPMTMEVLEEGFFGCPPHMAEDCTGYAPYRADVRRRSHNGQADTDRTWIDENVIPALGPYRLEALNTREVRSAFWERWLSWQSAGATLWAEWGWPVEARFLASCVDDLSSQKENTRYWAGPAPLHEISTLRLGLKDPPRLPHELPAHNPVMDSRNSLRLLLDSFELLGIK